jgi:acetylornithine deacetylase/succinyl-diaminopimelate desuccinylase-like protein
MVVALRDNARAQGGHNATVGSLITEPGVVNVIPPVVTFSVDLRSQDDALLNRLTSRDLPALFAAIAAEERVEYSLDVEWAVPPTPFDAAIIERAEAVCNEHDYSSRRLWAGAAADCGVSINWVEAMRCLSLVHAPKRMLNRGVPPLYRNRGRRASTRVRDLVRRNRASAVKYASL